MAQGPAAHRRACRRAQADAGKLRYLGPDCAMGVLRAAWRLRAALTSDRLVRKSTGAVDRFEGSGGGRRAGVGSPSPPFYPTGTLGLLPLTSAIKVISY